MQQNNLVKQNKQKQDKNHGFGDNQYRNVT